ncbi:ABC transporter substrate-binding protein [Methanosarcina sp. 2.H.A.1B.4]|uniref:ABC transporter substrate-binding protein n=1 Tax=Methanosarcina sp. 2.H.A.1B.4 TaxID=1483600 RepID=UPI0006226EC6|nr:ABC transporter substrate-binding protein [Methanosarcina sp. 2.H.A.1B.4]KKG08470.1 ABC transporter substrate-binding protein [Methanosarcina sp. 2.H.A.1B.4]
MNRNFKFILIICMLFAVIGASACIGEEKDGTAKGAGSGENSQELVVGIGTDVNNWYLDMFAAGDARFVWSQVYETLVRLDSDLNVIPGLAESWETPDDGKTWIFHLRENVTFHDRTPFDADSVVFSYSNQSYVRQAVLKPVQSVEALDTHTVKFVLKKPMPLPFYLTHVAWPVMGPGCLDAEGNFVKPVGTGPFKFETQAKDQEIVLTRNEAYWGEKPLLDEVTFKVIPEAATRVIALETGEVDMVIKVPEYDVKRLEAEEGIQVHRKLTTFTDFLQFNCDKSPFNDTRIRQSVAYAVDTETLVNEVLEGIGEPAGGRPYSPVMMYSDPDLKTYTQDLDKARALLEEAGWKDSNGDGIAEKDGKPLHMSLIVSKGVWATRHNPMAQVVQGTLREVGMDVEIKVLDEGAISKLESTGDFGMILRSGYFVWGPYPKHFFVHRSGSPYSHYQNETYDKLVDAADMTIDTQKQEELYHSLQDFVIEEVPAFYLVHEEKVVATGPSVKGYTISSEDPWLNLSGVYLERK